MPGPKEPTRFSGSNQRLTCVSLGVIAAFGLLCVQFWQLQVVESHTFDELARQNMVRETTLKADRGIIYGEHGVVLADNRPSADVMFVPGDCPEDRREEVFRELEDLLGVSVESLQTLVDRHRSEPFTQIPVKRDISKTDRFRIEERSFLLPGVVTVFHPQRRYLYGKTAGQIMGYMNEISSTELNTWEGDYRLGDMVGRMGIESVYERELRGEDGFMLATKFARGLPQLRTNRFGMPYIAERDSIGHILDLEVPKVPAAGNPLRLTLDIELQAFCEDLLGTDVGAIVVLESGTGKVRALASTPTFDPMVFINGRSEDRQALQNSKQEMLNRCYREQYPPGSIYKIMLAAAGLEEGIITDKTTFFCNGQFRLPNVRRPWACWRRSGHGSMNIYEALAYSCDVYFYSVGLKLGPDKMAEWSNRMGMGVRTGIDLPAEVPGLIPTRAWKAEYNKNKPLWEQRWTDGDTLNVSIGQGSVSTTPLQSAVMMASVVNGGRRVTPYLNDALQPAFSEPFISEAHLKIIQRGLQMCVEKKTAPSGTGTLAFVEGFNIIGKTGTAQVVALNQRQAYSAENMPRHLRHHAWFVASVLDRDPEITICILIEHGEKGSESAAPLTRDIVQYYYANRGTQEEDAPTRPLTIARQGDR